MQEKGKRKEWIKTFAIIFLSVLLVLTFFSNTIQNYSLPEVAAQYTWSGSITKKVRGEGVIESSAPYVVTYPRSRKIANVSVRVGDEVQKGDVLYTLEEGTSAEIKAKEEELAAAKYEYEDAILNNEKITLDVKNAVESGELQTIEENQQQREIAQKKVDAIVKELEAVEKKLEDYSDDDSTDEEVKAYYAAKDNKESWAEQNEMNKSAYEEIKGAYESAKSNCDKLEKKYNKASEAYKKLKADSKAERSKVKEAKAAATTAKENWTKAKATLEPLAKIKSDYENSQVAYANASDAFSKADAVRKEYEKLKTDLEKKKEEAEEALNNTKDRFSSEHELQALYKKYTDTQKELEDLMKTEGGNEIVSPVAGTVLSLSYVAGQTIGDGEEGSDAANEVATVQLAGKGYTLSMSVTNEQATLLRVGDEAEVTNSWWYSDVHAKVSSIRPDRENPGQNKIVTFEVQGEVTNGQTLSLTVGQRTATYDNVVPNSAIREDNKGKFVYRITNKSTPLGTRYYAERVDVTVLAEDETQSAINGALENWEYIITTSSKPITEGQQVRLKD